MIIPNVVGPQLLHLNPGQSVLTTANIAAIDGAFGTAPATYLPYAYTATVAEAYDTRSFCFSDAGSDLLAGQSVAFGLFLSPDISKQNLLFQVSANIRVYATNGTAVSNLMGELFFGRKATNNTVVSSLAAPSNAMAKITNLACNHDETGVNTLSPFRGNYFVNDQIFTLADDTAFVYCFGFRLSNHGVDTTVRLMSNMSIRKYSAVVTSFKPER